MCDLITDLKNDLIIDLINGLINDMNKDLNIALNIDLIIALINDMNMDLINDLINDLIIAMCTHWMHDTCIASQSNVGVTYRCRVHFVQCFRLFDSCVQNIEAHFDVSRCNWHRWERPQRCLSER